MFWKKKKRNPKNSENESPTSPEEDQKTEEDKRTSKKIVLLFSDHDWNNSKLALQLCIGFQGKWSQDLIYRFNSHMKELLEEMHHFEDFFGAYQIHSDKLTNELKQSMRRWELQCIRYDAYHEFQHSIKSISLWKNWSYFSDTIAKVVALPALERLDLRENSFETFPTEILQCQSLKELWLDNNALSDLPEDITQLTQLEWLSMRNNGLTQLPLAITKLTHLHTLDISFNQISVLPEDILQLTQLKRLYLSKNQLRAFGFSTDVASIQHFTQTHFPQLEELTLLWNPIDSKTIDVIRADFSTTTVLV